MECSLPQACRSAAGASQRACSGRHSGSRAPAGQQNSESRSAMAYAPFRPTSERKTWFAKGVRGRTSALEGARDQQTRLIRAPNFV